MIGHRTSLQRPYARIRITLEDMFLFEDLNHIFTKKIYSTGCFALEYTSSVTITETCFLNSEMTDEIQKSVAIHILTTCITLGKTCFVSDPSEGQRSYPDLSWCRET